MLGLKKLIFWMVMLTVGYYGMDYVKVHTSGDVVAYKRFAKAVMQDDAYTACNVSNKEIAAQAFSRKEERMKTHAGTRVLFTYHEVVRQNLDKGGKVSSLIVDQVSRVDSQGQTGVWGDREIRVRHQVELQKEDHSWKVVSFSG